METEPMTVRRWRRYGRDRLYVEHGDGAKVGWWDLATGQAHPESVEHLDALTRAVTDWKAGDVAPATTAASACADPAAVAPPWHDLATNRAGAEARARAERAMSAAPLRNALARMLGVHTEERAWRIGADGEQKVGAQLAKVAKQDPRWRFLHAIPVGDRGADIDHLVIGPGGVFTINAKHHPRAKIWVGGNTMLVNGAKTAYVRNSRHEAQRASRLLGAATRIDVHVHGLVVMVGAADVVVKSQPQGVSVTWRNNLASWLLRHGDVCSADKVEAVYQAARRSTTWRG